MDYLMTSRDSHSLLKKKISEYHHRKPLWSFACIFTISQRFCKCEDGEFETTFLNQ